MISTWLIFGFVGWIVLMVYRYFTNGLSKTESIVSYIHGFGLALLIGPFCFAFLGYLLLKGNKNDNR